MGYLNEHRVYLSGPIGAAKDDGMSWRQTLTPKLKEFGLVVADPTNKTSTNAGEVKEDKALFKQLIKDRKFKELKEKFYPVVRYDLRQTDLASFLIVEYDPNIPTVGTWHEVVVATHIEKKPVLIHCAEENLDKFNPWILTFIKPQWLFTNWDDMISYLRGIDKGNIDTSHWILV